MKLEQARRIGMEIVEALAPACDRVMIAGSVRRGKATPKDIEIVYIARSVKERLDLFNWSDVPATEAVIEELVRRRFWQFDDQVRRNGPLYKRMVVRQVLPLTSIQDWGNDEEQQVVIELFRACPDNWGYILALRTGPGDFNKIWAAKPWKGGSLPTNIVLKDGFVWCNGRPVPTPTEEEFFERIGIPCWPPSERSALRLAKFLLDRQHKGALLQQK